MKLYLEGGETMRTAETMISTYRQIVREYLALQRIYNRLDESEKVAMKIVMAAHLKYRAGMEALLELSKEEQCTIYHDEQKKNEQSVCEPQSV